MASVKESELRDAKGSLEGRLLLTFLVPSGVFYLGPWQPKFYSHWVFSFRLFPGGPRDSFLPAGLCGFWMTTGH